MIRLREKWEEKVNDMEKSYKRDRIEEETGRFKSAASFGSRLER